MIFDTHLHLIYPDRLDYPWLSGVPALNRPAPLEDYMTRAARLGITGCLHMEVDVASSHIRSESDLVKELMRRPGSPIRGAISACRPEEKDFPELLEWAAHRREIKGFRRVLHVVPDDISRSALFRDNVRRLGGTGWTFDIVVRADQLPLAAALIDHCPDVTFVLDHFGNPDVAGGGFDAWAGPLADVSARPNVHLKISGILANVSPETWTLDDLRPYFHHAAECFGVGRLLWGSDRPVCDLGGGIEVWVAATHALVTDWSAADRAALLRDNARRIWGIET